MLIDKNITEFLTETASVSPAPGGGSVAALSAALSAALVTMVANLTIGKKGYEEVLADMENIRAEVQPLIGSLASKIDEDSAAFNGVIAAFQLPKNTAEEKQVRLGAIEDSMKMAALVPLSVAQMACGLLPAIETAVRKGNSNAVSDAAVAAMMARTAALAALYNVKINLTAIKDVEFTSKMRAEVSRLETEVQSSENRILAQVERVMGDE